MAISVVYCLTLAVLSVTTSVVEAHAGTIINVYSSDETCYSGGSEKTSTDRPIVAFSVAREAGFSTPNNSIISMDHEFYNDGGYFDMTTNIFTAPVSGLYAFYFGACGQTGKKLHLYLYIKNKAIASTYNYNTAAFNHASGSVYKKMKAGDTASMWLAGGFTIWQQHPPSTHFNGHLINKLP